MKKIILLTLMVFLIQLTKTSAQITFDHTVDSLGIGNRFNIFKLSENETKYFMMDTTTNTFSIYNLDFTPFMTNISVPVTLYPKYIVIYITRTLFDCDSSNIEFIVENTQSVYDPFYILRTDGTILLQVDSARAPYCYGGCLGGSDMVRPIVNTENGARLFLMKDPSNQIRTDIYSLCGSVPASVFDFSNLEQSFVKLYPNPSSNEITFELNLPSNVEEYQIVIYDTNSKELSRQKVSSTKNKLEVDVKYFNSGAYYYNLISPTKNVQSGKFILEK